MGRLEALGRPSLDSPTGKAPRIAERDEFRACVATEPDAMDEL